MSHTEEEARKKWCAHARVAVAMKNNASTTEFFGVGGCNRGPLSEQVATMGAADPRNPDSARCIASECMAWRFLPQQWRHKNRDGGTWLEEKEIDGYGRKGEKLPTVGYCGLAGKP